tara:strand:- start:79 stop:387 length:309 start_codon:yes stop_codon:yes gene_type:complete
MNWKNILKGQRPDYPDIDGDGDTEEPMKDALETVEQVESVKKLEPITMAALAALAGYTAGGVTGWISGNAHMEQKMIEEVKAAIQEVVEQNKPLEIVEEPVE